IEEIRFAFLREGPDLPWDVLAALIMANCIDAGSEGPWHPRGLYAKMEAAAAEINTTTSYWYGWMPGKQLHGPLGLAQISPVTLATVVGPSAGGTYILAA